MTQDSRVRPGSGHSVGGEYQKILRRLYAYRPIARYRSRAVRWVKKTGEGRVSPVSRRLLGRRATRNAAATQLACSDAVKTMTASYHRAGSSTSHPGCTFSGILFAGRKIARMTSGPSTKDRDFFPIYPAASAVGAPHAVCRGFAFAPHRVERRRPRLRGVQCCVVLVFARTPCGTEHGCVQIFPDSHIG